MSWLVCQIGAREHYAIARALSEQGELKGLITDFWVTPGSLLGNFPGTRRLKDRYHLGLNKDAVVAPNARMMGFEIWQRFSRQSGWPLIMARNELFQRLAVQSLSNLPKKSLPQYLFSYSYAALDLFRYAKLQGWTTVLGQIDPGPEEERIVAEEHVRYPNLGSTWNPAPPEYWRQWREELELADRIVVNSEWSRECLLKEGVSLEKMEVVPLVYENNEKVSSTIPKQFTVKNPLQVLFLGQVILRKGIGRLLDAMRMLKEEPIKLTLAGPSEIDAAAWADLANVRWVGPVPRSLVGELYGQADVFILPTLSDGYAITQLEALSHGLPVIASRHCGGAVVHGKNGWILSNLEPESIRDLLLEARDSLHLLISTNLPEFGLEKLSKSMSGKEHFC